jgi:hypothetical protein
MIGSGMQYMTAVALFLNIFHFTFLEDEIFANDAFPDVLDIFNDSFEVGGGVVRMGDEDIVRLAIRCGCVQGHDLDESGSLVNVGRFC